MANILAFIVKYPKYVSIAVMAVSMVLLIAYVHHKGGESRETEIKAQTVEIERKVQNEKDQIRNNRPDVRRVIERLFEGSF